MSTVINTPGNNGGDASAGWAVAVIILLAVIAGGAFLWVRYHGRTANPTTNIQVTIPTPTGGNNTGTTQ